MHASDDATEVTKLHDYAGNGTVWGHGTGSLNQRSGPKQDSGSIRPLLPIFTSFYIHYHIIFTSLLRIRNTIITKNLNHSYVLLR